MLSLYDDIHQVQNRDKAQVLEEDKYYNTTSMEIFTNDSREELESIETIV